jgi:nucleoside-diphosphate-sugar epimerase
MTETSADRIVIAGASGFIGRYLADAPASPNASAR